jgi:hypothetical protein
VHEEPRVDVGEEGEDGTEGRLDFGLVGGGGGGGGRGRRTGSSRRLVLRTAGELDNLDGLVLVPPAGVRRSREARLYVLIAGRRRSVDVAVVEVLRTCNKGQYCPPLLLAALHHLREAR